jgi:hypothetical protein
MTRLLGSPGLLPRKRTNNSRTEQRRLVLLAVMIGLLGLLGGTRCSTQPAPRQDLNTDPAALSTPAALAWSCTAWNCESVPVPAPPPGNARFEQDTIDLTGNGIAELIRRDGTTLVVHEQDHDGEFHEVWRSPEAWHVVDVALGDPNDDGRYEMMVAFWKDDAAGIARSHPFIVGYREGSYREVWGGSPAAEPIYELALADVDGDGVQDLIVLDAVRDTASEDGEEAVRTVSCLALARLGLQPDVAQR